MRFRLLPALLLFAASSSAVAASITYDVNLSVGGSTATGSITTDGNTGPLSLFDLVGYTLTINDGTTSTVLDLSNGAPILASNPGDNYFTATDTGLFVSNVAGSSDALAFYNSDFTVGLCFSADAAQCTNNAITGPVFVITSNGTDYAQSMTGLQEFAAVPGTTPEPSSLLLLGTGAVGVVGAMRRRFV